MASSKKSAGSATGKASDSQAAPERAIVFELESVAANSHAVLFDVLKNALAAKGAADLTTGLFARYCIERPIRLFMPDLLEATGKKQLSADKMADAVSKTYVAALMDGVSGMPTGLRTLIEKAAGQNVAAGAISCMDREFADALGDKLDLEELEVAVQCQTAESAKCVDRKCWLRLAASLSVRPGACVAVTATSGASKTALAAGMRVVACPGKYTGCQDFSGVDAVVNCIDGDAVKIALSLLEPRL